MALHIVLGDGEMPKKELTETLKDLWTRVDDDEGFWFIVQGKSDPSATDKVIVDWFGRNELYYETVSDDPESAADIYSTASDTRKSKKLATTVVEALNGAKGDGEGADVLALFASDDPTAEEDRWLNLVIQAAADAGFKSFALNDGMVEIDVAAAEAKTAEAEPDEEAAPPKASKRPAKKAAAPVAEAEPETNGAYTREQLEAMELPEIKEIASGLGIELPARTRGTTYIDHILGEEKGDGPVVEVAEPVEDEPKAAPSTNGQVYDEDMGVGLADVIRSVLVETLEQVLSALKSEA